MVKYFRFFKKLYVVGKVKKCRQIESQCGISKNNIQTHVEKCSTL